MKTKFVILVLCAIALMAFNVAYTATNKTAEVNQYEGVSVFTDCSPVMKYTILGTIKKRSIVWSADDATYPNRRDACVKKAKKQYPAMDGILLDFNSNGSCEATAIKFNQ